MGQIRSEFSVAQNAFIHHLCFNSALTVLFALFSLDGPIITEDELTSLPLVKVVPDGQYTGQKLNTVVRMMRGLLEQKVPLQEFEVRNSYRELLSTLSFLDTKISFSSPAESTEPAAAGRLLDRSDEGEQEEESLQEYSPL